MGRAIEKIEEFMLARMAIDAALRTCFTFAVS
jgi:hypothetical protein